MLSLVCVKLVSTDNSGKIELMVKTIVNTDHRCRKRGVTISSGSDPHSVNYKFPSVFLFSRLHYSVSAAPAPLSNRMGSVSGTAPALPLCDGHAQSLPPLPHPTGVWSRWCRHAVQLCSGGLQPSITGWDSAVDLPVKSLYQTEKNT